MLLVEQIAQILLLITTLIAFGVGWSMESFYISLVVFASGVVLTLLVCVPDWGFYNKAPLTFLPPVDDGDACFNPLDLFPSKAAKQASELRSSGAPAPTAYGGSKRRR